MIRLLPLVLLVACQPTTDTGDGPKDSPSDCEAPTVFFTDADGDGYGDTNTPVEACELPSGASENDADCNDQDAAAYPGATEVCDEADNDCDGSIDNDAVDTVTWYPDADGDGYGADDGGTSSCTPTGAYSLSGDDCDDADAEVHPGQTEDCNDQDDDCDGQIDEGEGAPAHWYDDADGDGYGDDATEVIACDAPGTMIGQAGDCDDADDAINPDAVEVCDGIDQDCTGEADDYAIDRNEYFEDNDGDGFGDPDADILACEASAGVVEDDTDCDDTDAEINPDGVEVCNSEDDDCDGPVDEGAVDIGSWHLDLDGDSYGDSSASVSSCSAPSGTVADGSDCNDRSSTIHPGGTETCNDTDDDCDDSVDEDATDVVNWYDDGDTDGYGAGAVLVNACDGPSGSVSTAGDCDDADAALNPGAAEMCDSVDNDCDGTVDDSPVDGTTYYVDADGDSFGNPASVGTACSPTAGLVLDGTDCDDTQSATNPAADEICDAVDNNCNGEVDDAAVDAATWYTDKDSDGYGSDASSVVTCSPDATMILAGGDCEDRDPAISPEAIEYCNGVDDDCDGATDSDAIDRTAGYADADGDGFGNSAVRVVSCSAVLDSTDCDDTDSAVYPGAPEVCDTLDNDCDDLFDGDDPDLPDFSGIVATDTTWTAAEGPYCLTGDYIVDYGATLTIESGAQVFGYSTALQVFGALDVAGLEGAPVVFDGVAIVPAGTDSASPFAIDIAYADIGGGSLYAPTGSSIYGSFSLTDSVLIEVQEEIYVWYPTSSVTIARNIFVDVARISVGTSGVDVSITNNAFVNPTDGAAIENFAAYGTTVEVHQNSFLLSSGYAVRYPTGYSDVDIDATQNYWGTTDDSEIQGMIYDELDDGTITGSIDYSPYLSVADPATPDVSAYWP